MSFKTNRFGIDFGELNQRIKIYSHSISRDAIGGEVLAKTLWLQCWAKIVPQVAEQNYQNAVKKQQEKCIFWVRYQAGFVPQMLISHDEKNYEVQSVINIEMCDEWLKIITILKI